MALLPSTFRTPAVQPIQALRKSALKPRRDSIQIGDARFQEYHETDHIVEDLQSGTIVERFVVGGSPSEAMASSVLQNLQQGDVHPLHVDYFIVRREFLYHAQSEDEEERAALLTVTWKRMPCPADYAIDVSTVLVSQVSWWSYDEPPQLLEIVPTGIPILRPLQLVTIRMPIVRMAAADIIELGETAIGRTNNREFLSKPAGYWLLEDVKARQLFGPHGLFGDTGAGGIENGAFEIAAFFKGDPWRHHERWQAEWPDDLQPLPSPPGEEGPPGPLQLIPKVPVSNSFNDMRAAHTVFTPFPASTVPFTQIIPKNVEACVAEDLSGAP